MSVCVCVFWGCTVGRRKIHACRPGAAHVTDQTAIQRSPMPVAHAPRFTDAIGGVVVVVVTMAICRLQYKVDVFGGTAALLPAMRQLL